ncbi:MAG: hypothetical protein KME47_09490 [Nodosilinea sp. WJT8-NPBG4]|jgi:hypothetical protein|nr:hypothetical protein [Nodosilinea sp. WJT8-NPBG4]
MSKPVYKSSTVQNAVGAFVVLVLSTVVALYNPDTGKFRVPNQIEIAALFAGAITLHGTIEGRKKATEAIVGTPVAASIQSENVSGTEE